MEPDVYACVPTTATGLQEVEYVFSPSETPIHTLYQGFCHADQEILRYAHGYGLTALYHPITLLTNNMFKVLSAWALAKLRRCQNPQAQREMQRFLQSLEESAYHLRLALLTDSTLRDQLLFPPLKPKDVPSSTS